MNRYGSCRLAAVLAVAMLAVGCSSRGHRWVVTPSGRIGPLRVDRSEERAIVAFAGRPDAVRAGRIFDSRPYRALGYGCSARELATAWPLLVRGPYCRTVFFLNPRNGRLGAVYTSSRRYTEIDGVRIGMPTAVAERLLHRRVHPGCEADVYLGTAPVYLTVDFRGGRTRKTPRTRALRLVGGHVAAFILHGRDDVGVFDCL